MALIEMDFASGMGGGIDLLNPDEILTKSLTKTGTATITTTKKPKYIIFSTQSNTTYYSQFSIYDVKNDSYYGTYMYNQTYQTGTTANENKIIISNVTDNSFTAYNSSSSYTFGTVFYLYY